MRTDMELKKAVEITEKIKNRREIASIVYLGDSDVAISDEKVNMLIIYSQKKDSLLKEVDDLIPKNFQVKHISLNELKENPILMAAVSGEGILLHGKAVEITAEKLKLKSRMIISYDTTDMTQNDRNKMNRALYGGTSSYKKGDERIVKEYHGLVEKVNADKLGKGVLMVDRFNSTLVIQTLRRFGAKWREIPVWAY